MACFCGLWLAKVGLGGQSMWPSAAMAGFGRPGRRWLRANGPFLRKSRSPGRPAAYRGLLSWAAAGQGRLGWPKHAAISGHGWLRSAGTHCTMDVSLWTVFEKITAFQPAGSLPWPAFVGCGRPWPAWVAKASGHQQPWLASAGRDALHGGCELLDRCWICFGYSRALWTFGCRPRKQTRRA